MNKHLPDEIKAGMELLDEKAPGWREKIELDELDLSSCWVCVLGQVFGDYHKGLQELDLVRGGDHGFDKYFGLDYKELTAAWKEALTL